MRLTVPSLLLVTFLFSCSSETKDIGPKDALPQDADAGVSPDAEPRDADPLDAVEEDAKPLDTGVPDSGESDGGMIIPDCIEAEGTTVPGTDTLTDDGAQASVAFTGSGCARTYSLSTTATLRDNPYANPRIFSEVSHAPALRTNNDLFDALYALALEETRENSVTQISDGSFNNGNPLQCPTGGCFETGRLWKYVWTRDTAYAVDLSLAMLDPIRSKNSLAFKLSTRRDGTDLQIVQDTGTGGSYPVSSDRVVWAMGAYRALQFLTGNERSAFLDRALEAIENTIAHDRAVVFSEASGLYRGEQSFLDWREQSYPSWTATDVIHIGMSHALSTNLGHLRMLEIGAALATEKGDTANANAWSTMATDLRTAIATKLDHGSGPFAAFTTTYFDPAPVHQYDLLGNAFVVLFDVASAQRGSEVVASYPHTDKGPPVIWPQQQDVRIYHNRGLWPFVTAYWLRAAKKVENDVAVNHNVDSLVVRAALNLSNMENFEMVTGRPYLDDGANSGPVVNSQRQLWSVAGYLSMVHDVLFGLETTLSGIRFAPYVTKSMRNTRFAGADSLALNNLPYKGKRLSVVVHLPQAGGGTSGAYLVGETRLNGAVVSGFLTIDQLRDRNLVDIQLVDGAVQSGSITIANASDDKNLFGPKTPGIQSVALNGGHIEVAFQSAGENAQDLLFNIYRDGVRVASALPGSTTSWSDPNSSVDSPSYCYTVESYYVISNNHSQHASPFCYWGTGSERVTSIPAADFVAVGGTYVNNHGRFHYESWGDEGHSLTVQSFTPTHTGPHLLQVVAGNGVGPISTGITCSIKRIRVEETSGTFVGSGFLVMPHAGSWDQWRDSSFLRVDLRSDRDYRIIIDHTPKSVNMSQFSHFAAYTGGEGGATPFSRVNIAELKVLALTADP